MKSLLALATLFSAALFTGTKANAETLGDMGWLIVDCYSANFQHGVHLSISSDTLNGVAQVTEVKFRGKIKEALNQDVQVSDKPLVALAVVKKNNFKAMVRYENNLIYDNYANIDFTYKDSAYVANLEVTGDEGTYLTEKNVKFECKIGNNGQSYLTTKNFKEEDLAKVL
ncbi:MAG: hypothetical protein ACXVLQ_00470 [Bacteriovorax sp.]